MSIRLLSDFRSTPWVLEPGTMSAACRVIERWSSGVRLGEDEIEVAVAGQPAAAAQRRESTQRISQGGVAVVPVYGVLVHRAYSVVNTSTPLTSSERLGVLIRECAADPAVQAIVLDIDSPGGSVFGVQELAAEIAKACTAKRVVSVVNNTAASGGYWVASQAGEIVVTPSGMVGSIGVIVPHLDLSAAYAKQGINKSFITAGKYKAEGNDTGPLTGAARAHLQAMVDTYYRAFTEAVARGRKQPIDVVRSEAFGQGRMRLARDAVRVGMADSIGTLEQTVDRLLGRTARGSRLTASQMRPLQHTQRRRMTAQAAAVEIALLELS